MKAILLLLLLVFATHLSLADSPLSLEEATKIARQRARSDNLPDKNLTISLVDLGKDTFYAVHLVPPILDTLSNEEIVYTIEMDGRIERSRITDVVGRILKQAVMSMSGMRMGAATTPKKLGGLEWLNTPFKLQISSCKRQEPLEF